MARTRMVKPEFWDDEKLAKVSRDARLTIERAMTSEDWQKEGGKFIPYPATWLGARGWEDEIAAPPLEGAVSEVTARNLRALRGWRSPP